MRFAVQGGYIVIPYGPGTRRSGPSQGVNVLDYKSSARVVFLKRAFARAMAF